MSRSGAPTGRSGGNSSSSQKREFHAINRPRLSKTLKPSPIFSSVLWSNRASAQRLRRKEKKGRLINSFTDRQRPLVLRSVAGLEWPVGEAPSRDCWPIL